ncbi:MAG: hypothetical protein RLO01_03210 [Thalassobaculaceae bacterium]
MGRIDQLASSDSDTGDAPVDARASRGSAPTLLRRNTAVAVAHTHQSETAGQRLPKPRQQVLDGDAENERAGGRPPGAWAVIVPCLLEFLGEGIGYGVRQRRDRALDAALGLETTECLGRLRFNRRAVSEPLGGKAQNMESLKETPFAAEPLGQVPVLGLTAIARYDPVIEELQGRAPRHLWIYGQRLP